MLTLYTDIQTRLPEGFSVRPPRLEDAQAVADLINAQSQAVIGAKVTSLDDNLSYWNIPTLDIEKDTLLVIDEKGLPAAYADVYDVSDPHVHIYSCGFVRPDLFGRGLGGLLADWLVERARNGLHRAPEGARVVLAQNIPVQDVAGAGVLESRGFERVRGSYQMRIDMQEAPTVPEGIPGILIRPIDMERDFEEAVRTIRISFRDHYGFVEEPFEQSLERWRHIASTNPHFDPSVWFMAMDGDQAAGTCFCTPHTDEDPTMAWVNTLGVRREWRGRGVGYALLRTAFAEFYRRGFRKVGLGVDAQSLTGATRLYEKAGMHVSREYHTFEKEIRPGYELATQTLK